MNPSQVDFNTPFDPTGFAVISGAELQQLVSGLAPVAYIGWNVVSDDDNAGNPAVPNANTITKWQYYTWIRRAKNGGVVLYVWNPNGAADATFLNWQVANISSIIAGSITGTQIAALTITGANIATATITWDKLTNGAAVGGCLTGNLPNPALGNAVVGTANIALGAIVGGDPGVTSLLADGTIQGRNITIVDANGILDTNVKSIAQAGGGLSATGLTGKLKLPNAPAFGMGLRVASTVDRLEYFQPPFYGSLFAATSANGMDNVTNGSSATVNAGLSFAHGLEAKPTFFKAVLLCVTNDAATGKNAGDEIDINSVLASSVQAKSLMACWVDANNIYWSFCAATTGLQLLKSDGTRATPTAYANFKVKVYAAL